MKVLILEDDDDVAALLAEALTDAGHTVLGPARTVIEAYAVIARGQMPEVALVDLNLQYGSRGADFANGVRQKFDFPCIYVTGQLLDALQHRHLALGYIGKPFRTATVLESLEVVKDVREGRKPERVPEGLRLFD